MTRNEYLSKKCEEFNDTEENYYKDAEVNYVIQLENGEIYSFADDDPVIYGSIEDAQDDMYDGDKLITEKEYIDSLPSNC